jgi:hypothetical protein
MGWERNTEETTEIYEGMNWIKLRRNGGEGVVLTLRRKRREREWKLRYNRQEIAKKRW